MAGNNLHCLTMTSNKDVAVTQFFPLRANIDAEQGIINDSYWPVPVLTNPGDIQWGGVSGTESICSNPVV